MTNSGTSVHFVCDAGTEDTRKLKSSRLLWFWATFNTRGITAKEKTVKKDKSLPKPELLTKS